MKRTAQEFERFDATIRRVLSVSRDELKKREAEWKRQRAGQKPRGRQPKNSVASPASIAKD